MNRCHYHQGRGKRPAGSTLNRRRLLQSLAAALGASAWTGTLPRASIVPGGVARIRLGASETAPRVRLAGQRVLVVREGGEWIAVVGLALDLKPGSKVRLQAEHAGGRHERLEIEV